MNRKYNLLIPMAGLGSRFSNEGYTTPKPLLPVGHYRMFELVVANMCSPLLNEICIVAPLSFDLKQDCAALSLRLGIPVHLVEIDYVTEGPSATALLGLKTLDRELPLIIANSDQYLDFNPANWIESFVNSDSAGSILCMQDSDPKWSFARLDSEGKVIEVVEKRVVSNLATCGVYFFQRGSLFEAAASRQMDKDARVNGEFYVGPVYNELISDGEAVGAYDLGPISDVMFGLGVPLDYERFLSNSSLVERADGVCARWLS